MALMGQDPIPGHKGVVNDDIAVNAIAKFKGTFVKSSDLVADKVPGGAHLGLHTETVVIRRVDAVSPHSNIGQAVVQLYAVIGGVEDVIAVHIDVAAWVRQPIGHQRDAIVHDHVVMGVPQQDALARKAPFSDDIIADNGVVHNGPTGGICVIDHDGVVVVPKGIVGDHDVFRTLVCDQAVFFIQVKNNSIVRSDKINVGDNLSSTLLQWTGPLQNSVVE